MVPNTPGAALPQLPGNIPPPPVLQASSTGKSAAGPSAPTFLNMSTSVPSKANLGQKQLIGA